MTALIILATVALACLVLVELQNRRFAEERREWCSERASLLQRIQAPEVAVAQHADTAPDGLLYVPVDDDEAWKLNLEEELSGS